MVRNPLYGFIAFLVAEGLVALGFISRESSQEAIFQIEEIVFYLSLALTGVFGFHKYIEVHKHRLTMEADVKKSAPVVDHVVKNYDPSLSVFTEDTTGTPPTTPSPTDEQQLGTISPSGQ